MNDRRSRREQRKRHRAAQAPQHPAPYPPPPQGWSGVPGAPPSAPPPPGGQPRPGGQPVYSGSVDVPSASTAYTRPPVAAPAGGPDARSAPGAAPGAVSAPEAGIIASSAAAQIEENPRSFVRVTIMFEDRRGDLLLPGHVPLAELLPTLVRRFTALTPRSATRGYMLIGIDGSALAPGKSLFEHEIADGAVLSLASRVKDREKKYDDIVEAVADAAAETNRPWTPEHTAATAVAAAAVLVLASLLLLFQMRGEVGVAVPIITGTLTVLHLGLAWVLQRMGRAWHAVAIALLASVAGAVTGFAAIEGPLDQLPAVFGGLGAVLTAGIAMPLLKQWRELLIIPMAVGTVIAIIGGLYIAFDIDIPRVGVTIAGLTGIAILAVPQMAMRMAGLDRDREKVDTKETRRLYSRGHRLMIAFWVSAALILLIVAIPSVQTGPYGVAVMALTTVLLAMSGRRSYARVDVLLHSAGALAVLVLTSAAIVASHPQWWPFVIVALLLVTIAAAAFGLVLGRTWTWMRRAADIIEILAIVLLIPATVLALDLW